MANFIATTACSGPLVRDPVALMAVLDRFVIDSDLEVGIEHDQGDHGDRLFLYGHAWPEAWRLPEGVCAEDFDQSEDGVYEQGADGFVELLKEIAAYLEEPLTVQAIGSTKCRYPLSACEWFIRPGGTEVNIIEFACGCPEDEPAQVHLN